MKQKCRNVLKAHKASKSTKEKSLYCWSQQELNGGINQLSVTVQTASATRDLLLIQQNEFR